MYSIHDLTQRFRISKHTVHKYVSRGILPPANATGAGALAYDKRHVDLLEKIWGYNGLKDSNITLEEFRIRHNPKPEDYDC